MPNIWHLRHQTLKTKHCVKCIKILRYITVTFHLSFFASLHLLCSRLYLLLSFFPPFFLFCHFLSALSPSLSLFFFPVTFPLSFFSPPRPLLLRSAVAVEFGLAVEFTLTDEVVAVEISDSDLLLFFFPFGCGFHVIVIMGELVLFQALFFGIVLC